MGLCSSLEFVAVFSSIFFVSPCLTCPKEPVYHLGHKKKKVLTLEQAIDSSNQWKQKVKDFAVKPDHEYEKKNFMVTLLKIVMNQYDSHLPLYHNLCLLVIFCIPYSSVQTFGSPALFRSIQVCQFSRVNSE